MDVLAYPLWSRLGGRRSVRGAARNEVEVFRGLSGLALISHVKKNVNSRLIGQKLSFMKKIFEYREHAEECRTMAKLARSQSHREMLLNMAATWDGLAKDRERTLATKNRIAKIESDQPGDDSD